jgi:hypothetical protein
VDAKDAEERKSFTAKDAKKSNNQKPIQGREDNAK